MSSPSFKQKAESLALADCGRHRYSRRSQEDLFLSAYRQLSANLYKLFPIPFLVHYPCPSGSSCPALQRPVSINKARGLAEGTRPLILEAWRVWYISQQGHACNWKRRPNSSGPAAAPADTHLARVQPEPGQRRARQLAAWATCYPALRLRQPPRVLPLLSARMGMPNATRTGDQLWGP